MSSRSHFYRLLRCVGHLPLPYIRSLFARVGLLDSPVSDTFAVPFFGIEYHGALDQLIDRQIFFFGSYAPGELAFLADAATKLKQIVSPLTFVDIGANVGQHSLFMSAHADRILAFEPNPAAAGQLRANIQLNRIGNIELFEFALGATDTVAQLGSGFEGNSGSRSLMWSADKSKNISVEVRRGDEVLGQMNIERVNLIKMDVEGYELEVFSGIRQVLRRDRPIILFEVIDEENKELLKSKKALEEILYDDVCLFTVRGGTDGSLEPPDWRCNDFVVIPKELISKFPGAEAARQKAEKSSLRRFDE
jgi:FkbM family methyltransferase